MEVSQQALLALHGKWLFPVSAVHGEYRSWAAEARSLLLVVFDYQWQF